MALHQNSNENNKHTPKGFTSAPNMGKILRDENGLSTYVPETTLPASLNFVNGAVAPPTEVLNQVYVIVDTGGGTIHPSWDGLVYNNWCRFDGASWIGYTPVNGDICYDSTALKYKIFQTTAWIDFGVSGGGGGGEVNTSSNSGAGEGLALTKVGSDLPFKSIKAGTGITLASSANELEINGLVPTNMANTNLTYDAKRSHTIGSFETEYKRTSAGRNEWFLSGLNNTVSAQWYMAGAVRPTYAGNSLILGAHGSTANIGWSTSDFQDKTFMVSGIAKDHIDVYRTTSNWEVYTGDAALTSLVKRTKLNANGYEIYLDTLIKGSDTSSSTTGFKVTNSANTSIFEAKNNGVINASNLPTSAAGLSSGDIWNNSGVLNIV